MFFYIFYSNNFFIFWRTRRRGYRVSDATMPSQPRDVIEAPEGPMTRARTKRFKEQLNLFMTSFFKKHEQLSESMTTCVHVIQATEGYKISPTDS